MWNECWSCEMSKKKSLPVFSFFFFFYHFLFLIHAVYHLSSSLIPWHGQTEMLPRVRSENLLERVQFRKKNEIKNCQSLLQCCCRHPPLPLCHTASHVRVHAQTANVIPTSPQLWFASSKAVVFPPGMSRRFLFHRHTVKFTTPLHPDNLTKSPLCVVYQPRKLSYASKRYNGLGPNGGAWSVKLLGNSWCGFRRYVTMFFSPPSWFSW